MAKAKQLYTIMYDDAAELWLIDGLQELNATLREVYEDEGNLDGVTVWKLGDKMKIKAEFILEIS